MTEELKGSFVMWRFFVCVSVWEGSFEAAPEAASWDGSSGGG